MRRLLVTIAATAVILGLGAATATAKHRGWGGKPAGSIVDVAVKASSADGPDRNPYDYDLLIAAVTATGLAPTLADESKTFTVFAPNDRAFKRLVADLSGTYPASEKAALDAILATFTVDQIRNVLLYHVVAGKKLSPLQVLFARSLTMANGGTVRPRGHRSGERVHLAREHEDLMGELEQLAVLVVLLLHRLPLLVGDRLLLGGAAVLADPHERR